MAKTIFVGTVVPSTMRALTCRVDRQLDAQHTLRGNVHSTAQGYLCVGFSYNTRISNADTYTGWIQPGSGTVILYDEWSPNYNQPYQDTSRGGSSDIADVAGKQR